MLSNDSVSRITRIQYFHVDRDKAVRVLRKFFEKYKEISFVILFGSATRREIVRDIDVLVHAKRKFDFRELSRISLELEEELGVPVDLVTSDQVYPQILYKALINGVYVMVRDKRELVEVYERALADLMDIELKIKYDRVHV
jgi:predicted nucleotidyltransferase